MNPINKWKAPRRGMLITLALVACVGVTAGVGLRYITMRPANLNQPDAQQAMLQAPAGASDGQIVSVEDDNRPLEFVSPLEGTVVGKFGWYRQLPSNEWRFRDGLLIQPETTTLVAASADGTVVLVEPCENGAEVRIKHRSGYETCYSPLQQVAVAQDDQVHAGDPLGSLPEESALSTLSFKVLRSGETEDPQSYL